MPLRHPVLSLLACGVAALLLAGCGAEPAPTPSPADVVATAEGAVAEVAASHALASTAWQLDNFGPPEDPVALVPNSSATVTYFWDRYAGFDGCNWFLGVYSADADGNLRMQTPAQTLNTCDSGELYDQAATVVAAMLSVVEYDVQGDQLVQYTTGRQPLMTFSRQAPVPALGTTWDLKLWWSAETAVWTPLVPDSSITITFDADSQASGFAGCNSYSATFAGELQTEEVPTGPAATADLPSLTFESVAAQDAACETPEGVMEQEQRYLAALGEVAAYVKVGATLLLIDAAGTPRLAFAPALEAGE